MQRAAAPFAFQMVANGLANVRALFQRASAPLPDCTWCSLVGCAPGGVCSEYSSIGQAAAPQEAADHRPRPRRAATRTRISARATRCRDNPTSPCMPGGGLRRCGCDGALQAPLDAVVGHQERVDPRSQ